MPFSSVINREVTWSPHTVLNETSVTQDCQDRACKGRPPDYLGGSQGAGEECANRGLSACFTTDIQRSELRHSRKMSFYRLTLMLMTPFKLDQDWISLTSVVLVTGLLNVLRL